MNNIITRCEDARIVYLTFIDYIYNIASTNWTLALLHFIVTFRTHYLVTARMQAQ